MPGSGMANWPISKSANGWFGPCGMIWTTAEPGPWLPANWPEVGSAPARLPEQQHRADEDADERRQLHGLHEHASGDRQREGAARGAREHRRAIACARSVDDAEDRPAKTRPDGEGAGKRAAGRNVLASAGPFLVPRMDDELRTTFNVRQPAEPSCPNGGLRAIVQPPFRLLWTCEVRLAARVDRPAPGRFAVC